MESGLYYRKWLAEDYIVRGICKLAVISRHLKMKKEHLKIIFPLCIIFLCGCFGQLSDSNTIKIIGKYKLIWVNLPELQHISEQVEKSSSISHRLVPEYVFAVGHNHDYIIAKQHPLTDNYEIDTQTTYYYIVDMNRIVLTNGNKVLGPLMINQFNSLRKVFQIEKIEFDQNYPDKP